MRFVPFRALRTCLFAGCALVLTGLIWQGLSTSASAVPVRPAPEKKDDAEPAKKEEAGTFHAIVFEGTGNINLKQTNKESVVLNGQVDDTESRVDTGVLYLSGNGNYDVEIKSVTRIIIKKAGNLEAKNLNLKRLEVVLEGGEVNLNGTVEEQNFTVVGAGNFECKDLKGRRAIVTIAGAGNAVVQVTERLDATISGAGTIEFVGQPAQVQENITGAGQVQQYVARKN